MLSEVINPPQNVLHIHTNWNGKICAKLTCELTGTLHTYSYICDGWLFVICFSLFRGGSSRPSLESSNYADMLQLWEPSSMASGKSEKAVNMFIPFGSMSVNMFNQFRSITTFSKAQNGLLSFGRWQFYCMKTVVLIFKIQKFIQKIPVTTNQPLV